jgi:hypothetical protein
MPTSSNITARDLVAAEREVQDATEAWERCGRWLVTQNDLRLARAALSDCEAERRQLDSPPWAWVRLRLAVCFLLWATNAGAYGWAAGGFFFGAAFVVLAALPAALLFEHVAPTLTFLSLIFVGTGTAGATLLFCLRGVDLQHEVQDLRSRLRARQARLDDLNEHLAACRRHYSKLIRARDAWEEQERAVAWHARLTELLSSRRYRLARCDWRGMRGPTFERFIAGVFEELGYDVESTGASGDQGVDLIARGRGRVIAIQTKGYEGSVGNKAIQEAYAGMTYYRCRECLAVTNSRFTRGALDLARAVDCSLIDGAHIPDLIDGRLF